MGPPGGSPVVQEEEHDKMRAGLIAKAVDHITLLIEDWFTGVVCVCVCVCVYACICVCVCVCE